MSRKGPEREEGTKKRGQGDVRWCSEGGRGQDERTQIGRSARGGKEGAEELGGRDEWTTRM